MNGAIDSFRNWLRGEILQVLNRNRPQPPVIVWCDPSGVWKELLAAAAAGNAFELWADEVHELVLRERFYQTPRSRRVVWLPVSREAISYFKVFQLQAEETREMSLEEALAAYGVTIPPDELQGIRPLLSSHAKEWLDYPLEHWKKNLSQGGVISTLIDDSRFLEILASPGKPLSDFIQEERLGVLNRRAIEDFGLPGLFDPRKKEIRLGDVDIEGWRVKATACLLVTEAAVGCPDNPPGDEERTIKSTAARELALKMLSQWQKQIDLLDSFEALAQKADTTTNLQYWANNLPKIPHPLSSPVVERRVFEAEVERLAGLDEFEDLAKHLEARLQDYRSHAQGFWSARAKARVSWDCLAELARVASLLYRQHGAETAWQKPKDAMEWFASVGWQVDEAGEMVMREDSDLPGGLVGVRAKLRRAYLRFLDRTNSAFSELLAHSMGGKTKDLPLELPYVGEVLQNLVDKATTKELVAVLVLDACRYDLGTRLANLLNKGEPTERAKVSAARAPLPSITALGMPFLLPGLPGKIRVSVPKENGPWVLSVEGFDGNLAEASDRREWLKRTFKLKDAALLSVEAVLDSNDPEAIKAKNLGKLVFVFGDDLDDHDGKLKPFGPEQSLERYARVIRRLRSGGYSTVVVATDHGFFHWDPEKDEIETKPEGEIVFSSRRAVVGYGLKHPTALKFDVAGSELECCVPRSVNAFKTYGGLGFLHGGATLQELIVPVVIVNWPKRAMKIKVVLKPVPEIVRLSQKVEIAPAQMQLSLDGAMDENLMGRQVLIKVLQPDTGKVIFKGKSPVTIEPGGATQAVEFEKVKGAEIRRGAELRVQVVDADDEEILDQGSTTLEIDLDEW